MIWMKNHVLYKNIWVNMITYSPKWKINGIFLREMMSGFYEYFQSLDQYR